MNNQDARKHLLEIKSYLSSIVKNQYAENNKVIWNALCAKNFDQKYTN
jgi:hypothetical protein